MAFGDECGDFRRRWWMWNSGDWEWRLSERRGSVREVLKGSVWEWEGESERETGLCEKEGEWEWRVTVRDVNFEKTLIWNRVLKTRFPGLPRDSTTSQLDWPVDTTWEIESERLDFQVATWKKTTLDLIRSWKPSLKDSVYKPKIDFFRLKILVNNILLNPCLLTK